MILDKTVSVKITNGNIGYYKSLGYKNITTFNNLTVNVSDLKKGSDININVKCDICEAEKMLSYRKYLKNTKNINIYCCSEKCSRIKVNSTSLKIYGFKSSLLNKDVLKKSEDTKIEKYGDVNYNNPEKTKQTCLKKFGTKSPLQNNIIAEKSLKTNIEKYGVGHHLQNKEMFEAHQLSGYNIKFHKKSNLNYQGTYENHFLDYCVENNIDVVKIKPIKYFFEHKIRYYYPDFYIPLYNLIIEIKSDYYYYKYLNKNLAKQEECVKQGYKFIFIINKNYSELDIYLV